MPSHRAGPPLMARTDYGNVCAAALLSFVLGLGCAAFALTASLWAPGVADSTHAMNLGLAAGALAAMPVVIALGMVLRPRFGTSMRWSTLLLCAGLAMEFAAQMAGAGHSLQWPLTLLAATLAGFSLAVPIARFVSAKAPARIAVAMALGLAGGHARDHGCDCGCVYCAGRCRCASRVVLATTVCWAAGCRTATCQYPVTVSVTAKD